MNVISRFASLALLLNAAVFASTPASAVALIQTQPPCTTAGGACMSFSGTDTIPTLIRSIAFSAPSKGKAAVSFTGSMFCQNNDSELSRVLDFVTGITLNQGAVPTLSDSGALRQAMRLAPLFTGTVQMSATFNLASTRVFAVPAAGVQNYFFKLNTLRMDSTTACTIYDASFTIIFIP
jgi:hypothetical protein